MNTYTSFYDSPIGLLKIVTSDDALTHLGFALPGETAPEALGVTPEIMSAVFEELTRYFDGSLKEFTVKTVQKATSFRAKVFSLLKEIPYGETLSYKELAAKMGSPNSARAVGGACHNNGILIVVPCHRVVGSDGSLTGFGGGIERKKQLLELERNNR